MRVANKRGTSKKARLTVLVAESDRAMRELLRVHLHNAGYSVILAPDATVAGRTILGDPDKVDLLIVNAHLPFMSGIDFLSTMIADSSFRYIPAILISTNELDARRADVLGVPSLIVPFSAQQLLHLVASTVTQPEVKAAPGEPAASMRERLDNLVGEVTVPLAPEKSPLRVVIADDEADTVTSLMTILCHEGHSVFGSHHGTDVLPEVRMNKPDAVILDIDMPRVSGYAIARDIRELFGEASPLLIAVSGKWVGQTDRMLAELAGFDHFMQKPCHPDALLALLERTRDKQQTREAFPCDASLSFLT
ncbi:MAG TPA: response regulator [Burkholderiales bacterium]|nr:response regulator [Burkholderiales bacterium]